MDLTDDTPVKLTNNDDRDYSITIRPQAEYGAEILYVIKAHETVYWTWRVAKHLLGDPLKIDLPGYEQGRLERERAHNNFGRIHDIENYTPPHIDVFTMQGDRIAMAIEYEGNREAPILGQTLDAGDLQARMTALQAEIDLLRANTEVPLPAVQTEVDVAVAADPEQTVTSLDEIPTDDALPVQPRRSGQPRPAPLRAPVAPDA